MIPKVSNQKGKAPIPHLCLQFALIVAITYSTSLILESLANLRVNMACQLKCIPYSGHYRPLLKSKHSPKYSS